MWKNIMSLVNDPMKNYVFWLQNKRVDNRIKLCRIVFSHINSDFGKNIFCCEFSMFEHAHIFFSIIMVCTHLRC
jgi:hypothetical protein